MGIEIKWKDSDPATGERRYLRADRFAGAWRFCCRRQRRDVSWRRLEPTLEMWEHVLESLRRRYRRREGVSDEDVEQVERLVRELRQQRDEEE
ncbi:MAG TPA: hypothetical protein VFA26_26120 [Gemmataceae bacterium]|nr:hypothetical protein [Gemmataceae bacterium]